MAYKGMNHYEVGATQGHSKKKVDSMIKRAKTSGAKMSAKADALKSKMKEGASGMGSKAE